MNERERAYPTMIIFLTLTPIHMLGCKQWNIESDQMSAKILQRGQISSSDQIKTIMFTRPKRLKWVKQNVAIEDYNSRMQRD